MEKPGTESILCGRPDIQFWQRSTHVQVSNSHGQCVVVVGRLFCFLFACLFDCLLICLLGLGMRRWGEGRAGSGDKGGGEGGGGGLS